MDYLILNGMKVMELAFDDLSEGVLATGFSNGCVAAIIHVENNDCKIWAPLMENYSEVLPWEAPLVDIARNHHGSTDITLTLGDAFYFQPDQHSYIARKMEVSRDNVSGELEVAPSHFRQGDDMFTPRPETLSMCWTVAEKIMLALTPAGTVDHPYRVAVQRLKYQSNWRDFAGLMQMTENSLGRWGRLGFAIDRSRQRTVGLLSGKGPSDLIGMLMMMPIIRSVANGLNALAARFDTVAHCNAEHRVIEKAHFDKRYFSALTGCRDTVRTEAHVDGKWVELPVGLDTLTVFPGQLAALHFGLRPTLHRVLHAGDGCSDQMGDARKRNVTVLVGAV